MREYNKQWGKNEGIHYIFDNTTEAIKYLTGDLASLNVNKQDLSNELTCFPNWWTCQIGDWCKTDDGFIVQCLNKWVCHKKDAKGNLRHFKTGVPIITFMFTFVFGSYAKWFRKSGEFSNNSCKAALATPENVKKNTTSIGSAKETHLLGKYNTARKQWFSLMLAQTKDPIKSLVDTLNKFKILNYKSPKLKGLIPRTAIKLLTDPHVIANLKLHISDMEQFKQDLLSKIDGHNLDIDDALAELDKVLHNSPVTSPNKMDAIKTTMNLRRYLADDTDSLNPDGSKKITGSNGKSVIGQAVQFEELGEASKSNDELPDLPKNTNEEKKEVVESLKDKIRKVAVNNGDSQLLNVDDILPKSITGT